MIDLDSAPAVHHRPGRSGPRGRFGLAGLSLVLVALLGPATPPGSGDLRPTIVPARNDDNVFVSGDRLYVVDATPTGRPHRMRTYRLPDGRLLAQSDLPVPEPVTGVRSLGATTLIATTVGQRAAVMAIDTATGRSLWWQFGLARAASETAGLVLLTDNDLSDGEPYTALDLRTGQFRRQIGGDDSEQVTLTGPPGGAPRWLVTLDYHQRLDTYDAWTGKHLATASGGPLGPVSGAADDLFLLGGSRDGLIAYALPGLTPRWRISPESDLSGSRVGSGCGALLCLFRPALVALDPASGKIRWNSGRWTHAETAGGSLVVSDVDGEPDRTPLTVVDPATGRTRAGLGGWREMTGPGGPMSALVHPGRTTFFGRFDAARAAVRIVGATDRSVGHCDSGAAGSVVCHLADGPVAIWAL